MTLSGIIHELDSQKHVKYLCVEAECACKRFCIVSCDLNILARLYLTNVTRKLYCAALVTG